MPRMMPRYGFFAKTVMLTSQPAPGLTATVVRADCMMILINKNGITIATQPLAGQGNAPFKQGQLINVSLEPILLHQSSVNISLWTMEDVEVKWIEPVKDSQGGIRGWLLGMAFSSTKPLPKAVEEWIEYIALASQKIGTIDEPRYAAGENAFIGLNAIGVALGICALIWWRRPEWLRDTLLGVMVGTTIIYGLFKIGIIRISNGWIARFRPRHRR